MRAGEPHDAGPLGEAATARRRDKRGQKLSGHRGAGRLPQARWPPKPEAVQQRRQRGRRTPRDVAAPLLAGGCFC